MTKTVTLFAGTAMLALSLTGCFSKKKINKLSSNELAFIEYYVTLDGVTVQGTPPPGMRIDGPTYQFNPVEKTLNSYIKTIQNPDEIIAILGAGRILRGTEGGGLSSRLVGIKSLPHAEGKLQIIEIGKDAVKFSLLGETITLKPGESIERVFESTDSIPWESQMSIVQKKVTHQLSFRGIINRENFTFPKED